MNVQESLTKAMIHLPPGEITKMNLEADAGSVIGVSHEGGAAFLYSIEGPPADEEQTQS